MRWLQGAGLISEVENLYRLNYRCVRRSSSDTPARESYDEKTSLRDSSSVPEDEKRPRLDPFASRSKIGTAVSGTYGKPSALRPASIEKPPLTPSPSHPIPTLPEPLTRTPLLPTSQLSTPNLRPLAFISALVLSAPSTLGTPTHKAPPGSVSAPQHSIDPVFASGKQDRG